MFRSWAAIGSPIYAEIEGGRGQNGTFLGDFTWNDPYVMVFENFDLEGNCLEKKKMDFSFENFRHFQNFEHPR